MTDQEKVIKGLECAIAFVNEFGDCAANHGDCPYASGIEDCHNRLLMDALALLKSQHPRVMTLEEMNDMRGRGKAIYYEDRDATCKSQDVFVVSIDKDLDVVWLKAETYTLAAKMSAMGKTWRCWTSRPTDEQRRAEPWK